MNIVIFGIPGASLEMLNTKINRILHQINGQHSVTLISDLKVFLKKSLDSVPAVQIDEEIICLGEKSGFHQYILEIIKKVLSKTNRESIRRIALPLYTDRDFTSYLFHAHQLCSGLNRVLSIKDFRQDINRKPSTYDVQNIIRQIEMDWVGGMNNSSPIIYQSFPDLSNKEMHLFENVTNISLILLPLRENRRVLENYLKFPAYREIPIYLMPEKSKYKSDQILKSLLETPASKRFPDPSNGIYKRSQYLRLDASNYNEIIARNEAILII